MAYNLEHIDPDQRTGLYADPSDEEPPAPPRRVFRIAGTLLVMALFAGGLWFAYIEGTRHAGRTGESADIPLIRADSRPIKVKPDNPGGMHIADRDMLIYGQNRPAVEHLLPPPEQPMPLPAAPAPPSPAPKALATEPVPQTSPPTVASAPPALSAARPPANSSPAPTKAAEARSQPGKPGGLRLQLGAVRSEAVAREEWDRMKRMNPDLLGHLTAVAVRAELGDKGVYYRIQAGPVGDTATAHRLCGELIQRHLGCIIVR